MATPVHAPPRDVAASLTALGAPADRLAALGAYVALLDRWRRRINLIGPCDAEEIWRRHILDSAQAWPHLPAPDRPLLDLGSGAGLPGLVLAILGATDVTLVDSDQRKCVFLAEAARAAGVDVRIAPRRFDDALDLLDRRFAVVTGRAVAPVARIAPILARALAADGYALLHKGARHDLELTEARKSWTMQAETIPSITDRTGVLLKIWGIEPDDGDTDQRFDR